MRLSFESKVQLTVFRMLHDPEYRTITVISNTKEEAENFFEAVQAELKKLEAFLKEE